MEQAEWVAILKDQLGVVDRETKDKEEELARIQQEIVRPLQEKRAHLVALIELEEAKQEGVELPVTVELPEGSSEAGSPAGLLSRIRRRG